MVDSPQPGTILLIEDEAADVALLIRAFKQSGVTNPIRNLRDGEQALAYLEGIGEFSDREKNPLPILVLLDLRLPRMSGLELLQWMRPRKHLRRIPVVVLTVEKDPSYMEAAYDLGANSYLIKSPKEQDVLRVVELIQQYWIGLNERAPIVLDSHGSSFGSLHT
ncbi:MAG TPA: response regulator [Terriglobales bacterium]